MKTFKSKAQYVVTTRAGRKIAECAAIEHAEPIAHEGRGRDVWRRNKGGKGYSHHRTYNEWHAR